MFEKHVFTFLALAFILVNLITVCASISRIELNLYADGGVSFSYRYPFPASVNYDVRVVHGVNDLRLEALVKTPIRVYYEEHDMRMNATLDVVRTPRSSWITDEIRFSFSVFNATDAIYVMTGEPIVATWNVDELRGSVYGAVVMRAGGERGNEMLNYLYSSISEELVRQYLVQVSSSIATLKSMTKEVVDGAVVISFFIDVDMTRAVGKLLRVSDLEVLKKTFSKSAVPARVRVVATGSFYLFEEVRVDAVIDRNTNDILRDLADLHETVKQMNLSLTQAYGDFGVFWVGPEALFTALMYGEIAGEFVKNFEVMPSETVWRVTGNFTSGMAELRTPKIVKKGASSPAETVIALHGFISRVPDVVASIERTYFGQNTPVSNLFRKAVEQLMNTTTLIVAEENVKVLKNGEDVREAAFKDLPNLEFVVLGEPAKQETTPTTKQPEASFEGFPLFAVLAVVAASLAGIALLMSKKMKKA